MNKNIYLVFFIAVVLSLVLNCGKKEETEDTTTPATNAVALTAEEAKGKEIFTINCVPCHGATGAGDGVAAAQLNPKPRNYKAPAADWKNGNTIEGITKTLNEGVKGSPMVPYKHLGDESIKALANYVLYLSKN